MRVGCDLDHRVHISTVGYYRRIKVAAQIPRPSTTRNRFEIALEPHGYHWYIAHYIAAQE